MRRLIALALAGGLLASMLTPAAAKPVTVWEDAAGDAGNADSAIPGFDYAGFDIISGTIDKVGKNLEFTVNHSQMLPSGSLPEGFRFLWAFSVGKEFYRLTIKRADVGKPDVGQNQTSERVGRADVDGHFRLEGDCGSTPAPAVLTFVNCGPLAYLEGTWDPATMSVTMVVPLKLIKAKPGSVIGPGGGDAIGICSICWTTHTAERSLSTSNIDTAAMSKTYKVPK